MAKLPVPAEALVAAFGPHLNYPPREGFPGRFEPDAVIKTHCCFCGMQCGIKLLVKNNHIVGFEPWEEFPFNEGRLCPKGVQRYLQNDHPDRLLTPIVRVAGKGFEKTGWDPAMERIVSEIQRIQSEHGNDAFAMQKIAHQLDEKIFADWTIAGRGALKGEALQAFVNEQVGNRALERLKKPLAVVATDLNSGERVVFRTGETGLAVRASAAVPGIFQPTPIMTKSGGRNYVDGGLTSPIPVQAVREMGAEIVIAVDISDNPAGQSTHNLLSILWQTTTIMGKIIASNELKSADIVIRPKLPRVKSWDFKSRNEAMLEGEKAAQAALPIILKKLER